ncbi:MAG TPA: DinB family protein [Acidobacteriaceae bacterium]|jgi:uncharacterized damage-inducible protein DinB|nr:DinB family protein [Acidobacteriaceae bacterium]
MRIADLLTMEFEAEAAKTRSYFAVLPEDKADWKPHELSPGLGSLAKHIANLPGFGAVFLTTDSMDASGGPPALPEYAGRTDLQQTLEQNGTRLREALANASDDYLKAPWAFKAGDKVLEEGPRAAMYQLMCVDHMVHHRAQMGVYLRMLGVPLPGLYGPSADGPWQPAWPRST